MTKSFNKSILTSSIAVLALSSSLLFAKVAPDNTKINQRDRASHEVTADQQKNNKTDTEITRRIRQDLMKDKDLSTYAHNIKIITIDGKVTLKGPVNSKEEESKILAYARTVAGDENVTDQIDVTTKNNN